VTKATPEDDIQRSTTSSKPRGGQSVFFSKDSDKDADADEPKKEGSGL
jgi:hypothetical protein